MVLEHLHHPPAHAGVTALNFRMLQHRSSQKAHSKKKKYRIHFTLQLYTPSVCMNISLDEWPLFECNFMSAKFIYEQKIGGPSVSRCRCVDMDIWSTLSKCCRLHDRLRWQSANSFIRQTTTTIHKHKQKAYTTHNTLIAERIKLNAYSRCRKCYAKMRVCNFCARYSCARTEARNDASHQHLHSVMLQSTFGDNSKRCSELSRSGVARHTITLAVLIESRN